MKRANNRIQALLQCLFNKTLDERLDSVEFEDGLLRKFEEATLSRRQLKKMPEAMLNNQDFIAPGATIVEKDAKKAMDVESEKKDRHRKFVGTAYNNGARSAASSDGPPTNISNERTNKRAFSEMSEEQVPDLPPWSDMTVGNKSMWYKTKPERELDVPVLRVIEPINLRLATAVDHQIYRFLENSSSYVNDVAHELHKLPREIVVQMKESTSSRKNLMSVVTFPQEFK